MLADDGLLTRARRQRVLLILGAVAVLAVAFVVLSGGDDEPATPSTTQATTPSATSTTTSGSTATSTTTTAAAPTIATVRVVGGKPQGGVRKLTFHKRDQIRFRVVSDTASEIHVHGYDLMKDVTADGTVTFSFPGSIDGRFFVELEDTGTQIAQLDVEP